MCLESETHGFTTDTSSIIIPNNTDNEKTPIPEESVIRGYTSSSRVDTEIISKRENNSRASAKAHMSSLIESNPQIPIGGIGVVPVVAMTRGIMEQQSAQVRLNFWDGKITFWLYDLGQQ
ncbi:6841_t:CDS:2, partial [Dentiscutata erythropus]